MSDYLKILRYIQKEIFSYLVGLGDGDRVLGEKKVLRSGCPSDMVKLVIVKHKWDSQRCLYHDVIEFEFDLIGFECVIFIHPHDGGNVCVANCYKVWHKKLETVFSNRCVARDFPLGGPECLDDVVRFVCGSFLRARRKKGWV